MKSAFLLLPLLLAGCGPNSSPSSDTQPVGQPAERHVAVTIPDTERDFMQLLLDGAADYKAAPNELKKSSIKKTRDKKIDALLDGSGTFSNWYAVLSEMGTTSEGDAYITVSLPDQLLTLKTWNNGLSDISDKTLIKNGSPLYEVVSNLEEGQYVAVSGNILQEGSVTEAGSMQDPEFIVRFNDIKPVQ